eukprot:s66_g11.t1
MSETAATAVVQKQFAAEIRKSQCRMLWSPPVEPHCQTNQSQTHARGKASGVAVCSKIPARPVREALPDQWATCTRYLHTVIQLGQSHCQLVVLYCKPTCQADAIDYNNQLMSFALQQISLVPLPYLILGDFNMALETFDAWPMLEAKGCRALNQLYPGLYSTQMPQTCMEATRPDNAVISPSLVPLVSRIEVLDTTWFATHRPVMFELSLPGPVLFAKRLKCPKSFVQLDIPTDQWENMQDFTGTMQAATTIQQWGEAVEANVDFCLRQGHGSQSKLTAAYRGRCQSVSFVRTPVMSPTKVAAPGSYEPSSEVLTVATRRKVTQVRRLESIWRRLKKLALEATPAEKTTVDIALEWKAALKSHAFGVPFLHWLCLQHGFDSPSWPLPQPDWMYDALQFARYHVEAALKQDAKIYRHKTEYKQFLDQFNHNKAAYALVRGPGLPRVHEIGRTHQSEAIVVPSPDGLQHCVYLDEEDASNFSTDYALAIDDTTATVVAIEDHCLHVRTLEPKHEWPEASTISQSQLAIAPADLAMHLDRFWKPIWNRDQPSLDFIEQPTDVFSFHELLSHLPAHPQISIDMLCQESWTAAIKKLKAHSAIGTDRISAQELKMLPTCFIAKLSQIMSSYNKGFPEEFMQGLICPLAKVDGTPEAHQTRPIMLLPQLYRLWSAVMTAQITRVLCQWIPVDITGLLPKRGAASTAYFAQYMIEHAKKTHKSLSGITLDIIKCFNCLRWDYTFHAMKALGIPQEVLVMWISSISALTRHWVLHNQIFTAGGGSTGFPEGDQFSVVAMIAVAVSWSTSTRAQLRDPPAAYLSAYADNWSWVHGQVEEHKPTLQNTMKIMAAAGTAIDWQKTWFWSTCHQHASSIHDIVQQCVPGRHIQQKTSAADLGFQLQYSGNKSLGIMSTRLQKGFQRLLRLQAMPHTLSIKETMLRTSIYPAALHGTEIKPLSIEHLQQLRTRAARALFGHNNSLSPAIALTCTKGGILDPEFWITLKALTTARHFLLSQPPQVQKSFFYLCSRFQGNLANVTGPASALSFLLSHLSLQIDAEGFLHATAFLKFPVLQVSLKRLTRHLQHAWMDRLVILHSARYKWYSYPDIDRFATTQTLQRFADTKRWMLIREIAGAYQVASQKKRWLNHETGLCPHCQMPDSRFHRLVECPLGTEIRQNYQVKIDELLDAESLLLEYPVITIHPNLEAVTLMQFHMPEAIWNDTLLQLVHQKQQRQETLHWFTDGSSMIPGHPNSCFSAYSVVLDLCHSDEERCLVADQFRFSPDAVPSLQVACTARGQGEQDILRAETFAILAIAEKIGTGIIHSDSQTAIGNVRKALLADSPADFASCEHMDLLFRIWVIRHNVSFQLDKVKSHQHIHTVSDPLLRYWAMGNHYVDRVAQHTCRHMMPDFVQTKQMMHAELEKDQSNLETIFELHLELQDLRAKTVVQQVDGQQTVQHDHRAICAAFGNWTIPSSPYNFAAPDLQFIGDSAFGLEVAQQTCSWIQQLQWPATDDGPLGIATGVSWVELGLSWMLYHKRYVPILRKDNLGILRLVHPATYNSAKDQGLTYLEAGTMMQRILDNVTSMIPETIWPDDTSRQKVWDAWSFFKLLDRDGGGSVEIEEFLKGCLRFRGQARAIDIGQLIHDQEWLIKNQGKFQTYMELELGKLKKQLAALNTMLVGLPLRPSGGPSAGPSPPTSNREEAEIPVSPLGSVRQGVPRNRISSDEERALGTLADPVTTPPVSALNSARVQA